MNAISPIDFTPRWNPLTGLISGPSRPPAVHDPHEIIAYAHASTRLHDTTRRADELRRELRSLENVAADLKQHRAALVRKIAQGGKVHPSEAGDVDRREADAAADARLKGEVLVYAEKEVAAAAASLKAVLKAEALRYLARLREDALEARGRFIALQNEYNSKESWARDLGVMVSTIDDIDGWNAVLGITSVG